MHLLGLEILLDTPRTQFASKPRLLVATPGCFHIGWLHVIDPDDACAQGLHSTEGLEDIASPDGSGETVRRVVGDLDCVFFILKGYDRSDRAEYLFARNAGAIVDIIKDGWLDVEALGKLIRAATANCQLHFFLTELLVRTHTLELIFTHQRSHLGVAVEGRTQLDLLRLLGHGINKLLVDRFLHQDAAAGRADFALIDKDAEQSAVNRGFEILVGEENVGRLSAQFESD